jgi:carbonic anhydrase
MPGTNLSPDEALVELMAGNARYTASEDTYTPDFSVSRAAVKDNITPLAGILGCADARVAAEMIFDRGPGDLFMVRVAGNFVSEYGLASLEYCVEFLHVPLLMVLGHSQCGAVTGALQVVQEGRVLPGRLPILIEAIEPAVLLAQTQDPHDLLNASIAQNVKRQVRRLSTLSPVIDTALHEGRVKVVGAVYDLATGRVSVIA